MDTVVEIHLPMADTPSDRYFALEEELTTALESTDVGHVDGNDVGQGEFTIFAIGPDGAALLHSVRTMLPADLLHQGAHAVIRRQDEDELVEERFSLAESDPHEGDEVKQWKPLSFGATVGGKTKDTEAFFAPMQRLWKTLPDTPPSSESGAQLVVIWQLAGAISSDIGERVIVKIASRRERMLGADVPVPHRPRTTTESQSLIRESLREALELSRALLTRKRLDWDLTDIENVINDLDFDRSDRGAEPPSD